MSQLHTTVGSCQVTSLPKALFPTLKSCSPKGQRRDTQKQPGDRKLGVSWRSVREATRRGRNRKASSRTWEELDSRGSQAGRGFSGAGGLIHT